MNIEERKMIGLVEEICEELKARYNRNSARIAKPIQLYKELLTDIGKVISDSFKDSFILGVCNLIYICFFLSPLWLISLVLFTGFGVLMLIQSLVVVKKTIARRIGSNVILTATKRTAYTILRYNLWRMLKTYQDDFKIRLPEHAYSMTPSNPYVLRGNVWMCCYVFRKKQPIAFESEHMEFIKDTTDDEINAMIENRAFEGVVYPCSYRFVVDEVIDSKNTARVYVLLIEDERDIAYINNKNAIIHDAVDALEVLEDSDFGKS